ncbi:transposase [Nitrococcus mobilis]|uniref:Transposase n=1 Tax=Nitrococcus mobilis Nb-231 TaxID=314278 RepID=A4BPU5_9GAMM|nr:transposase [Nitrococcus mobilis]EAR22100.1 hypothetical protein NB231_04305 [Nitrococcus mobilis Nb-231]
MSKYPDERRAAALVKLMPPSNRTVSEVAAEEGVSTAMIYNWRKQARNRGQRPPDVHADGPEGWTARDKFAAVLETAAMNEHELERATIPSNPAAELLAYRPICGGAACAYLDTARVVAPAPPAPTLGTQVGEPLVVEDVALLAGAQQLEEVDPALGVGAREEGESLPATEQFRIP